MPVRVVRFTGVTPERMAEMRQRISDSPEPPAGAPITGLQVLVDEAQQTAIVLQHFDSQEDMEAGDRAFGAMDPSDTPGSRASVDRCEMVLERRLGE